MVLRKKGKQKAQDSLRQGKEESEVTIEKKGRGQGRLRSMVQVEVAKKRKKRQAGLGGGPEKKKKTTEGGGGGRITTYGEFKRGGGGEKWGRGEREKEGLRDLKKRTPFSETFSKTAQ